MKLLCCVLCIPQKIANKVDVVEQKNIALEREVRSLTSRLQASERYHIMYTEVLNPPVPLPSLSTSVVAVTNMAYHIPFQCALSPDSVNLVSLCLVMRIFMNFGQAVQRGARAFKLT